MIPERDLYYRFPRYVENNVKIRSLNPKLQSLQVRAGCTNIKIVRHKDNKFLNYMFSFFILLIPKICIKVY